MATMVSMTITPMVTDTATAGTTEVSGVSSVDFDISVEGFDPTIKKKSCHKVFDKITYDLVFQLSYVFD